MNLVRMINIRIQSWFLLALLLPSGDRGTARVKEGIIFENGMWIANKDWICRK
jgi:hypothetical protein